MKHAIFRRLLALVLALCALAPLCAPAFAAQEALAPSQTMPDVTASAFTIVWEISRQPPPCRYAMPAPAPAPALTAPQ